MKTRQLTRYDIPKNGASFHSLRIPVLFNNKKAFVCDKHFGDDSLCFLENNNGIPVKINSLEIILDERSKEEIMSKIRMVEGFVIKSQNELEKLKRELNSY